uniref:HAMP domain-containing protein n=1 Tax=Thermodesulfobacterium geofontis TaxID=1295609 RepID=A0A7V4JQ77_9BACT
MGLRSWFRKLNKTLELHQKIVPIIVICFIILIVLTIVVTSFMAYYVGINHAKNIILKNQFNLINDTIIKHGALIEKMEGNPIGNYKIIREEFLKTQKDIRIIRTSKIDELFGKESLEYYAMDKEEARVLLEGVERVSIDFEKEKLKGIYPIKAQAECLRCHYNVSENEVIGAVNITLPIDYIIKELKLIIPLYIFLGLGGIITASLLVYFTYIYIAHRPLEKVTYLLNKMAEGDLTLSVEERIKDREDLIGKIVNSMDKVLEYMRNFSSKTLDYSIKLVEQVDDIFKLVDSVNEKIKFQNLKVAQTSIVVDDFGLTIGEISRLTSNINNVAKEIKSKVEKGQEIINDAQLKEILTEVFNLGDKINELALGIATNIEKGVKTSEVINKAFEEINQVSSEISQLMDKISESTYETLLISSYMKTVASTVKTRKMEEVLFDLFEKDIDRYVLRLQAHIKGIDRLDPERWGDYQVFPIGKWYYSEEGEKFKQMVKEFDFSEFEGTYKTLHSIGKELIIAYNREDFLKVEKLFQQLRTISRRLKLYLEDLRDKYLEYYSK